MGVLLPNLSLFLINFFFLEFFSLFFFDLPCKILSHLFFLFLLLSSPAFFVLFLFFELILNVSKHLLILKSNLFFLILNNRISERGHNLFDFLFSFSLFLFSFLFKFILKTSVLLLHFDILILEKYLLKVFIFRLIIEVFFNFLHSIS